MAPQGGGLWTPFLWQSNIVLCGNSVAQCCIVCHGGFPGTWPGHLPGNRLCQGQRESGGSHKEDWGRWHAKKVTLRQCNGGAGTLTRTRRHKTTERHRDMLARRESYSETMKRLEPRPEQCSLCSFDRIGLMFKVFKIQKLSLDKTNEVFFSFLGFTAAAEWPSRWCCVASSSSIIGILCQTFEDNIHMIFGYLKLACLLTQWAQQVKNGRAIWS